MREDLAAETGSKTLALAIGVALIDRTAMRVGRERYLDANGTRGAGTMFTRDIKVSGDEIAITFPAKSGKIAEYALHDAPLADAIARVKTIPGKRLLMYRDDDGKARAIRTEQLNRYLAEIAGATVTAKDFRTLHGSALAAEALAKLEPGASPTARRRQVTGVTKQVAAFLQNTPAICRQSYIAPCLFKLFDNGKLAELWASVTDPRSNTPKLTLEDRIADATGGAGAWVEEQTSENRNQAVGALGEHRSVMRRGNTCVEVFRSRIADSDPFNNSVAPRTVPMMGRPYKCR
ncbi:MAG: hypothetical protein EOP19_18880 [Hyphomicrobiales bacterium]|nr:MAG: hypothetical protein EOP19_18880 [Hyphomicrobiales bacterium]